MLTTSQKLEILTALGVELNRVADLDILMERILTEARRFVNADAGSIYIREKNNLHFTYSQNETLACQLPPGEKLVYSTFNMPIDENSIAGYVASTGMPLQIDDVYRIGPQKPFSFDESFDQAVGYATQSMLSIPLTNYRGVLLGVLQMINAKNGQGKIIAFTDDDQKFMSHFASAAAVALERARMTRDMILRMISMAEMRDPKETGPHVNRVGAFSVELYERWARQHGVAQKEIEANRDVLRMAAMMHDVGKVAISDTILKKPGRLDPEEYKIMKTHTIHGARLFGEKQSQFDDAAAEVALNHHEWWNGEGYPGHVDVATGDPFPGKILPNGQAQGKKEQEIPLFGRIVAITDVYDALCSKRVYKSAWKEEDALNILKQNAGKQFDPELVTLFFTALDQIHAIRARYPDEQNTSQTDQSVTPPVNY